MRQVLIQHHVILLYLHPWIHQCQPNNKSLCSLQEAGMETWLRLSLQAPKRSLESHIWTRKRATLILSRAVITPGESRRAPATWLPRTPSLTAGAATSVPLQPPSSRTCVDVVFCQAAKRCLSMLTVSNRWQFPLQEAINRLIVFQTTSWTM